jgi:hypothetical protein
LIYFILTLTAIYLYCPAPGSYIAHPFELEAVEEWQLPPGKMTLLWLRRLAKASPEVRTVLRYNQRGVGGSGGVKSVWGAKDCVDVAAVCKYILGLHRPPQHLYIVGYVFHVLANSFRVCTSTSPAAVSNTVHA